MTDKQLTQQLLKDNYISKRGSLHKRYGYALFEGNRLLITSITTKQFKRFELLLKVAKGNYSLNLTKVRQLHGKSLIKHQYKIYKDGTKSNNT